MLEQVKTLSDTDVRKSVALRKPKAQGEEGRALRLCWLIHYHILLMKESCHVLCLHLLVESIQDINLHDCRWSHFSF